MAQVISFPKEPRSAIEQTVRYAMECANLGLSKDLFDQVAASISVAAGTWNSFKIQFTDEELLALVPEITDDVRKLVEFAANKGGKACWANVLAERMVFERALALAGYYRVKK